MGRESFFFWYMMPGKLLRFSTVKGNWLGKEKKKKKIKKW
jgi:hypothetical protein